MHKLVLQNRKLLRVSGLCDFSFSTAKSSLRCCWVNFTCRQLNFTSTVPTTSCLFLFLCNIMPAFIMLFVSLCYSFWRATFIIWILVWPVVTDHTVVHTLTFSIVYTIDWAALVVKHGDGLVMFVIVPSRSVLHTMEEERYVANPLFLEGIDPSQLCDVKRFDMLLESNQKL